MKQYVVKEAYTGNYHVLQYVDGVLETHDIINSYALPGYIQAIENAGYTRACYEPEYLKKLEQAKEDYDFAVSQYEFAKEHSLVLSDAEAKHYSDITHWDEETY